MTCFFSSFFSGTEFNYTTHGYTLLSAVIESVSGEPFLKYIQKLFRELGLHNTYLDENGPIIPHRSRYVVCTLDMLFCRIAMLIKDLVAFVLTIRVSVN